jgi:hypothetical protein
MDLILGCTELVEEYPDKPYSILDPHTIANSRKFLDYFVKEFKKLVHGLDRNATVDVVRHGDDVILRVSPDIYKRIDYGGFVSICHRDRRSWE